MIENLKRFILINLSSVLLAEVQIPLAILRLSKIFDAFRYPGLQARYNEGINDLDGTKTLSYLELWTKTV